MKKLCAVLMMIISVPAFATTMCALNDTTAIILDPIVKGTTYSYDAASMTWNTTFPYGKVYGIGACISTSGTLGVANASVTAAGAERDGRYCWCKMTHPVASRWVFGNDSGSASNCASNCARDCGFIVQNYEAMRAGLFGSVAN